MSFMLLPPLSFDRAETSMFAIAANTSLTRNHETRRIGGEGLGFEDRCCRDSDPSSDEVGLAPDRERRKPNRRRRWEPPGPWQHRASSAVGRTFPGHASLRTSRRQLTPD